MKKLSIKTRLTFWYAFSLIIIIVAIVIFLLIEGNFIIKKDLKQNLITTTNTAFNDVNIVNNELEIEDDFTYYKDGVYIAIFNTEGMNISGLLPNDSLEKIKFSADYMRKTKNKGREYYVYDRVIENPKLGYIWIRGVADASLSASAPSIVFMGKVFIFILPLLVLIALFGGWYTTKMAFVPLKRIADTVNDIQVGKDLSKRIEIGAKDSKDEIDIIARTFDKMLERVDVSFQREKQFTNDASHELRTPVAVIMANCEYALTNINRIEEVEESLKVILSQSNNMSSLISQLLILARADKGIEILKMSEVDISLIAEEEVAFFAKKAAEKNIEIKLSADEGIYMKGDSIFLHRMFSNLIQNGIKYGNEKGYIDIIITQNQESISISCTDNGIGIEEKYFDKIWERFFRVNQEYSDNNMGLGLPLVKWIVEEHNGEIYVESEKNVGTSFKILFSKNQQKLII